MNDEIKAALNFLYQWRHELGQMEEHDSMHGVVSFIEGVLKECGHEEPAPGSEENGRAVEKESPEFFDARIADIRERWSDLSWPHIGYFTHKQAVTDIELLLQVIDHTAATQAPAQEWHPIETAPRDGTEILVCRWPTCDEKAKDLSVSCQVASWWSDDTGSFDGPGEDTPGGKWMVYFSIPVEPELHFEPTHWQPLPEPPQGAK